MKNASLFAYPAGLLVASALAACGSDTSVTMGDPQRVSQTPSATQSSAAHQLADHFVRNASGAVSTKNVAHGLDVALAGGTAAMTHPAGTGWHLGLRWTGIGRTARMSPVASPLHDADLAGDRASYLRDDGSEEWYESGPRGVEQGFVLAAPPPGPSDEAVAIEIAVAGDLSPALAAGGVDLRDARGATIAHYTDLSAADADGHALRAWIEVSGAVVRLRVDDAGARYPLAIDPVVWTAETEIGGAAAGDEYGTSVAVSGSLAVVGAPFHTVGANAGAGAAYVLTRTGNTWTQTAGLTASNAAAGDGFGTSVAVDGTTIVVGAPGKGTGAGEAYVFVLNGTTWTQQAVLAGVDTVAGDAFGTSVGVSQGYAVIGAPDHKVGTLLGAGVAYVFAQNGTAWAQQAQLSSVSVDGAAGDAFGTSVAISGINAAVGAPYHTVGTKAEAGVAYVFSRSGSAWFPQWESSAGDGAAFDQLGTSVSISGPNMIAGAPHHTTSTHTNAGAAYVFSLKNSQWPQTAELSAADAALGDYFGASVSISGTNAVVGASRHDVGTTVSAGVAYLFWQSCPGWTMESEVSAGDLAISDFFGYSVAVTDTAAVVGSPQHNVGNTISAGAAYEYGGVLMPAACCIDGTSVAGGAANPANSCQACTPATSTSTWSNVTDGTTCSGGTCKGGTCVPSSSSSSSSSTSTTSSSTTTSSTSSSSTTSSSTSTGSTSSSSSTSTTSSSSTSSSTSSSSTSTSSSSTSTSSTSSSSTTSSSTSTSSTSTSSSTSSGTTSSGTTSSGTTSSGTTSSGTTSSGTTSSGTTSSGTTSSGATSSSGSTGSGGSGTGGQPGIVAAGGGCELQSSSEQGRGAWLVGLVPLLALRRRRRADGQRAARSSER